jgi:Na+:H+ antiporter, NhaA family
MTLPRTARRARSALRAFLDTEAAGGILLMGSAALAMVVANSAWAYDYFHILHLETGPTLSPLIGPMTVHLWINDALMAIFFLLVGLEIKRELLDGHLATWADRRLPVVGAIAGMVVPAMIYIAIAGTTPPLHRGWAIPAATDIAFAIGVLALLGSRAPTSLKLLLTTIAIVDDMGAVAIIALVYTDTLNLCALGAAGAILAGMFGLNRAGVKHPLFYAAGFVLLWYAVLLSGVHATIAGVLAAFTVPFRRTLGAPDAEDSTLHRIENSLHAPVAYVIVPLFGFANAGVSLVGVGLDSLLAPLPLGIALGLFLGKQIGIFASIRIVVALGWAKRPSHASWTQVYGMALLCGIGFTMSLFIGGLAFRDDAMGDAVKIGVLMGSISSALAGWFVLRFASPHPHHANAR